MVVTLMTVGSILDRAINNRCSIPWCSTLHRHGVRVQELRIVNMDVMIVLVGVSELVMGLVLRVELVYSEVLAHLLGMHLLLLESQASCELLAVVERDELVIVTVEPGVVD